MDSKTERQGELIIFSEIFIWAFFPVITALSLTKVSSLVSLFWATALSGIFFMFLVLARGKWQELSQPLLWQYVFYAALFIGVLFYGFYFAGLRTTSPGNASIIALFEVFTSFVFFNLYKKEEISTGRKLGALLMMLGAFVVLYPNLGRANLGDFLVLAATFFSPIGNYFTQKALKIAASETILFLRSLMAAPFLLFLAWFMGDNVLAWGNKTSIFLLLINGLLIFGLSKILWVEGIGRISVTKAIALHCGGPLITLFLSWLILHQNASVWQLSSFIPFLFGVLLLTDQLKYSQKFKLIAKINSLLK